MLGVRLEPELEDRLAKLASRTGRSKSYYARRAIEEFLEDQEDVLLADAVVKRNEPTFSSEEVRRELGLVD